MFEIPDFQRQFAWEKENFEQLVEDIKDAIDTFDGNEPYFLGSIILWTKHLKEDGSGLYAVVDGQQRLISLAILMACLRDLTQDTRAKETLQRCIYQEEDEYSGTQERVRIRVRDKEYDFFKKYILTEYGTEELNDLDYLQLSEPQQHIVQASEVFHNAFSNDESIDETLAKKFIKYLLQQVVVVVVTTSSLASGFRLFNVINTRGMPFSEAGADFLGATVQLLTLRTGNPKKPYSLKVVRNFEREENELGEEIEARLDKLSELYKEAETAQTEREKSGG